MYEILEQLKAAVSDKDCWVDIAAKWRSGPAITAVYDNMRYSDGKVVLWRGRSEPLAVHENGIEFVPPNDCAENTQNMGSESYFELVDLDFYFCAHVFPKQ